MVAELVDYVLGADTHRDEHTLAQVEAASEAADPRWQQLVDRRSPD